MKTSPGSSKLRYSSKYIQQFKNEESDVPRTKKYIHGFMHTFTSSAREAILAKSANSDNENTDLNH